MIANRSQGARLLRLFVAAALGGGVLAGGPLVERVEAWQGAEETPFSGPQAGERLPAFRVRGVFGDSAGKELDFVAAAKQGPIVLIFVHDFNRPSVSFTRVLSAYTQSRAKDGLTTGVVALYEDATEGEQSLKRMAHALTKEAPTGISLDGKEGPGSYGLNRQVTLTILVGKDGQVTANFALVQPSLQADLPKVLKAIVAVAGGEAPKLNELPGMAAMAAKPGEQDPRLRELLRPVIQKDASDAAVTKAAEAVEAFARENEAARREIGRIANTIIDAGKLDNYGTAKAQEYLRKWAREYGRPAAAPAREKQP